MPTTRNVEPDPKPLGDPQPPKPEINPVPTGDPKPAVPGPEPRSQGGRQSSTILASRKVDDLSRHEARHDEPLTRKPNAREKPLGWVKPTGHGQPHDVKPMPENLRT
jgi:hypothetical protein